MYQTTLEFQRVEDFIIAFENNDESILKQYYVDYFNMSEYLALMLIIRNRSNDADFESKALSLLKFFGFPKVKYQHIRALFLILQDKRYFRRNLKIIRKREFEADKVKRCHVGQTGSYTSLETRKAWKKEKDEQAKFLANMFVFDGFTKIKLSDQIARSLSNPELMRGEMMMRIRGYQQLCKEKGMVAYFWTITAPSKYHRFGGRRINPKYEDYTPRDSKDIIQSMWAGFRSDARGIDFMGMFSTEAQEDATAHRHILIWCYKEDAARLHDIMSRHALAIDGTEKGAAPFKGCDHLSSHYYTYGNSGLVRHETKVKKSIPACGARFKSVFIDETKGDAVGYVAKYISKNLGVKVKGDDSIDYEDNGLKNKCWLSTWGLRQFQFFGFPPIGLYREIRRLSWDDVDALDNKLITRLKSHAETRGQFVDFVRLHEEYKDNIKIYKVAFNDVYDQEKSKIKGFEIGAYVEKVVQCGVTPVRNKPKFRKVEEWQPIQTVITRKKDWILLNADGADVNALRLFQVNPRAYVRKYGKAMDDNFEYKETSYYFNPAFENGEIVSKGEYETVDYSFSSKEVFKTVIAVDDFDFNNRECVATRSSVNNCVSKIDCDNQGKYFELLERDNQSKCKTENFSFKNAGELFDKMKEKRSKVSKKERQIPKIVQDVLDGVVKVHDYELEYYKNTYL